jgi:CspA family cold shock protein
VSENARVEGVVDWFNPVKGFGFLCLPGEEKGEVFLHFSEIPGPGYRTAESGDRFSFRVEQTAKGLAAKDVMKIA